MNSGNVIITAWISTAIAVCTGLYFTESAWCLWAMLIPFPISCTFQRAEKDES